MSVKLSSSIKCWIVCLLLLWELSILELLSNFGFNVQWKSPAIIQLPARDEIVRKRLWKNFGSSMLGAYIFIRFVFYVISVPCRIMYLPVLSLIILVTWNGMDLSIKIITPLAWEVKGAEYILPCHLLLIFASWLDNRWVSWSSIISECIDFTLVITCFTFFSFCRPQQFQEDILILNPPDIAYNISLASQYIQII